MSIKDKLRRIEEAQARAKQAQQKPEAPKLGTKPPAEHIRDSPAAEAPIKAAETGPQEPPVPTDDPMLSLDGPQELHDPKDDSVPSLGTLIKSSSRIVDGQDLTVPAEASPELLAKSAMQDEEATDLDPKPPLPAPLQPVADAEPDTELDSAFSMPPVGFEPSEPVTEPDSFAGPAVPQAPGALEDADTKSSAKAVLDDLLPGASVEAETEPSVLSLPSENIEPLPSVAGEIDDSREEPTLNERPVPQEKGSADAPAAGPEPIPVPKHDYGPGPEWMAEFISSVSSVGDRDPSHISVTDADIVGEAPADARGAEAPKAEQAKKAVTRHWATTQTSGDKTRLRCGYGLTYLMQAGANKNLVLSGTGPDGSNVEKQLSLAPGATRTFDLDSSEGPITIKVSYLSEGIQAVVEGGRDRATRLRDVLGRVGGFFKSLRPYTVHLIAGATVTASVIIGLATGLVRSGVEQALFPLGAAVTDGLLVWAALAKSKDERNKDPEEIRGE